MGEPLSPQTSLERRVSWAAFFSAIVLGWVLLWALGWSIGLSEDDGDLPAHALWRECPRVDDQAGWVLIGVGLLTVAGVMLIARAIRRSGWRQIGLWAGFFLLVDALLMVQYLRFFVPWRCD
jgi:hypothetical protein